jgi:hypothetical protein
MKFAIITAMVLLNSSVAMAVTEADKQACLPDARKLCSPIPDHPTDDDIKRCADRLAINAAHISNACLVVLKKHNIVNDK